MTISRLFSIDIYKCKFENIKLLNSLCTDDVLKTFSFAQRADVIQGNTVSSSFGQDFDGTINRFHTRPEISELINFVENHAKIYWELLNYRSDQEPKIFQSWVNIYHKDGIILPHIHEADIAVAIYLNATHEQGDIIFENPVKELIKSLSKSDKQTMSVYTGDVLIFPGWLKHYTTPNTTSTKRIVMSANLNGENI